MHPADEPIPRRPLAEPSELAGALRHRPLICSPAHGWEDVVLQRFQHGPARVDVPAMRDDVLVGHLGGPFLAEADPGTPRYERRWISPGELGVNPAGIPVRRDLKGRPDVVLVHIPPLRLRAVAEEMFEVDAARIELTPLLAAPDETAVRLIKLLLGEAAAPAPGMPLMVQSLTRALTVHALRHHSTLAPPRSERREGLPSGRVRRVVEHMRANLDQPLSLTDLAQTGGMSPSRFVRAFHAALGQPPHRFLLGLRIEQACRLLEDTELSITDVGFRCGFDQPSHFASMFRKAMGVPPGAWRRERRD